LCDRALLGAYSTNTQVITPAIVSAAANETLAISDKKFSYLPVFGLLLVGCIAAGVYFQMVWPKARIPAAINLASTYYPVVRTKPEFISQSLQTVQQETLPAEKISPIPAAKTIMFDDWINNPDYSLNAALSNALKLWHKPIPANDQVDCHYVEITGLRCVFGKANWKDMLAISHPAILEFSLAGEEKFYALLTGFGQNQSMIHFENDGAFPVADVLKYWNGYYLIVEPPVPDAKVIRPHQTSDNVLWLRHLLNSIDGKTEAVEQPRFYDDRLVARVIDFQHKHQLPEDGKVGDKTRPYLEDIARTLDFPRLEVSD
ncbi:MAG: peptidoglycan-binding protein, partial [Methylobacter sp.]